MEKKKNKKSIVIGMTSLVLVTLILLGLTYAYYKTRIVGNTSDKSVSVVSKVLGVKYQNESAYINATGAKPGYTTTKTFEVTNTGDNTVEYSVIFDNVENTFTRTQDWTYTISEGTTVLKSRTLPNTTSHILYSESINAGETKYYSLTINYANSNENQSVDMGKSLSFRINISDSLETTLTSASEGTLLYAIGRDNVVSEPLTIPGQQTAVTKYGEGLLSAGTSTNNVSSAYQSKYFVYGTGYTFDETTGVYTLTGVTTTTDTYASSYSELEGKYVASYSLYSISASTKESALKKKTSGLYEIYKITSATSSSYEYQTKGKATALETEAVLANTEDDYGISYYYRGAVENNYVNYSGMCWRIVRVQGDGTIKLALADENGECDADTYSTNNTNSALINVEKYNWTDLSGMEKNEFETDLSTWASNKNLDLSNLIENEWCQDLTYTKDVSYEGTNYNYCDWTDYDSNNNYCFFSYETGAFSRLGNALTANPTLKCDMTGIKNTKAIKYKNKLGMLSADEIAFAGHSYAYPNIDNQHYLQTNASSEQYVTFSLGYVDQNSSYIYMRATSKYLSNYDGSSVLRPAIVLNSNVTITSGNGTVDNPYVVG